MCVLFSKIIRFSDLNFTITNDVIDPDFLKKLKKESMKRFFCPSQINVKFISMLVFALGYFGVILSGFPQEQQRNTTSLSRERISLNSNWRFFKYPSQAEADKLIYDARPEVQEFRDSKDADSKPTEAEALISNNQVLKPWILPTGNAFLKDRTKIVQMPEGHPGHDFPFVQCNFDDTDWEKVNLPHDWAIDGPFFEGPDAEVGGGMGRLPSQGVAWYRKNLDIPASDKGKSIFLDVDGAMSYAMVWLNGNLVGGWPYGYASWRVDLTPYIKPGAENQLAIRLDNPQKSARWYPGVASIAMSG